VPISDHNEEISENPSPALRERVAVPRSCEEQTGEGVFAVKIPIAFLIAIVPSPTAAKSGGTLSRSAGEGNSAASVYYDWGYRKVASKNPSLPPKPRMGFYVDKEST